MSNEHTIECEDEMIAKAAMLFVYQDSTAPIIIYEPQGLEPIPHPIFIRDKGWQELLDEYFNGGMANFLRAHSDEITKALETLIKTK
jgi:hypothetical protein